MTNLQSLYYFTFSSIAPLFHTLFNLLTSFSIIGTLCQLPHLLLGNKGATAPRLNKSQYHRLNNETSQESPHHNHQEGRHSKGSFSRTRRECKG